jgi:hypothetical protein
MSLVGQHLAVDHKWPHAGADLIPRICRVWDLHELERVRHAVYPNGQIGDEREVVTSERW